MTMTEVPAGQAMTASDQLHALVRATSDVLNQLELLDACRFGPAGVVEAAIADLHDGLAVVDALGPKAGLPPLRALHDPTVDPSRATPDQVLANTLASKVRMNLDRIRESSSMLSLELRRLLADTRDVVSMASGGAGTYDAHGRTTIGDLRRSRGLG
jgi:hypothetical protein